MTSWYFFSILALLLLGTQRFLYKVTAERNLSSTQTTTVFMATVTLLSGAVFFFSGEGPGDLSSLIILALVNSSSFVLSTVTNMEALRHLPAVVTFPLTRLSIPVVIIISFLFFDEWLGPRQWLGILAGLAVVAVLAKEEKRSAETEGKTGAGFLFVAICVLCGALATISSKLAATSVSRSGFMALSYLLATSFSLALQKKRGGEAAGAGRREAFKLGLLMGVLNFFGFYAFLMALATGPLSVIATIAGMHFVIPIGLSVLLYRERMTLRRAAGIGLTLLAVIFLKH